MTRILLFSELGEIFTSDTLLRQGGMLLSARNSPNGGAKLYCRQKNTMWLLSFI